MTKEEVEALDALHLWSSFQPVDKSKQSLMGKCQVSEDKY